MWVTAAKKLQDVKTKETEHEQLRAELERKLDEAHRKQQVSVDEKS